MGDNGLPDQIEGIRQLGTGNPWMDLERIGIWGHSGGGFASTAGILRYPDFYKVAVSGAGNHDNRNYEDDWGEKWQGLLETYPEKHPDEGEPLAASLPNLGMSSPVVAAVTTLFAIRFSAVSNILMSTF